VTAVPPARRTARSLLPGLTAFGLLFLALGAWRARALAAFHGWEQVGLSWLPLEAWSRERPWVPAGVGALAVLALVLVLERRRPGLAAVRAAAHPLTAALSLALAFVLPPLVAALTRPAAPARAPNVLFVVIDTWRADHAGFLGYERDVSPRLDRLVERGVVFERAISQAPWTKPSVATMLTGLLPSRHHAVSQPLPDVPTRATRLLPPITTWVELLRGHGWQTAMWSDNPNITPPMGFGQGAGYFRDYFHEPCCANCGKLPELLSDVRQWLSEERDPEHPFALYLHVMDAHYPYEPPPEISGVFDRNPSDLQLTGPIVREYLCGQRDEARLTPERLESLVARYDEELLVVDRDLGAFLEEFLGEHPDTLIVLAGDHGEEFFEHGNLGHSHALYRELVHVPLVLWAPGLAPARLATQVRLMDVFPTLLALAGLADALPPGVQGESLLPVIAGRESADRLAPMETGGDQKPCWHWRGVTDGKLTLLRRERDLPAREPIPPLAPREESAERPFVLLFDLSLDPHETRDLFAERRTEAEALFAEFLRRGWYVAPEELLGLRAAENPLTIDQARELEALGYGGSSATGGPTE
jgi:arylsulfatase A-like enzyme